MSKKVIIVTGAAGLVSFAGAFVFAWLSGPSATSGPREAEQSAPVADISASGASGRQADTSRMASAPSGSTKKALTEQQLKNLVQDVRGKMQEYNDRLQAIAMRERRLQVAHNVLKDDIENLDNLRIEVASAITSLKSERDELQKSRLDIDQKEKSNLISIAATYDVMKPDGASQILTSLCKPENPDQPGGSYVGGKGSGYDDAVKILHYMEDRPKANVLALLAKSEPILAAGLCQRLKQIVESR